MTYKERLIAGLKALGYSEDPKNKSKYAAFVHPERNNKMFVGTAGALRSGTSASSSFSIGDPANKSKHYMIVLDAGEKALGIRADVQEGVPETVPAEGKE